jgi:hypothetical protein
VGFVSDWLKRRAAKKIAVRLEAELSEAYLHDEVYTPAQIRSAYARLKLKPKYIGLAFAKYTDLETYTALTGGTHSTYEADRALYTRFLPDGYDHPWEPAPMNEFVRQLGGDTLR